MITSIRDGAGRLSRRSLLGAGAALAATSGLVGLAGCESAVGQARSAASGAPRPGGVIRAGIGADLIPGNILTNSNAGITTTVGLVFESLIRYPNDRVEPTPRLATAWELAADGRSITLDLREDVVFHSGRAFTSKDVEFSIRTYGSAQWTAQLRSTAEAVTSFDTSDPHRIRLGFAHPLGNIFDLLDTVPILDSESIDQLRTGEKIIGTGPFRLREWTPNTRLSYVRNEQYWQPGRPYVDEVDVAIITDAKALLSSLRSGQIDLADGLGYLDTQQLAQTDGFTVHQLTGAEQQLYVGSTVTATPLDDVRVRQAIAYSLDRERIVADVLRGSGYPINVPWPDYSPAFDPAANQRYGFDTEQARRLVTEIGTIPTIPLTYNPTPIQEATAAIVQADLQAAGIPVELDPVDGAQFVKQLIGAQFKGLWLATHSWAQYTPSTLTVSAYPFNARKNASTFTSQAYIEHADAAWKQVDGSSEAAVAAYRQLSTDLLEALFLAEIAVMISQVSTSDRLAGIGWTKRRELQLTDAWLAED